MCSTHRTSASRSSIRLGHGSGALWAVSGKGNPYDNAKAVEVYLKNYRTIEKAEANICHLIEDVYNQKRLHSSSDIYLQPSSRPPRPRA